MVVGNRQKTDHESIMVVMDTPDPKEASSVLIHC